MFLVHIYLHLPRLTIETLKQSVKYLVSLLLTELTIETPKRRQWHRFGVFIVNFKHISHFVLLFLLLTLSR